ncbi:MAG TPA: hypothetical protein VIU41_00080, partial [Geobacteraceae bacterium]
AFTVGSSIVVTGTAADAIGLQRVEISLDGGSFWLTANLAGTTWQQTVPIPFQDFLIIVRAIDLAGNQSVSSWIPVTAAPPNSSSSKNGTSFSIRPLFQPSQVLLENITADANDGTICVSDPGMAPPFCGTVYLRFSSDGFTWTQWQAAVTNTPWLMQGNIVCTQFKNRFNTIISTNCLSVQAPSGPVRLDFSAGPSYFLSIATAIGYVANGQTIRLKTSSFTEDLNFNQALSVSLAGGFDDTYQSAGGASILNGGLSVTGNATITVANIQVIGTVTVTDGTVTTDNLSIL